ncbi:MAG: hypothetical protein ACYS8Z_04950 [Planctomycetota bacterium]|jgi:hypothetical protein
MEKCSPNEERGAISDRFVTVMGILVGLAAAPVVFLYTFFTIIPYMPWLESDKKVNYTYVWLTFFGAIAIGIAWSIFAAIVWKRGNVGVRIGLTLVFWAFLAVVALVAFLTPLADTTF